MMKAGHGSQQDVGSCGDGRWWGRAGWRFLISTEPPLHFLELDAVMCGRKGRLMGRWGHSQCNTCLFSLFRHLCVSIFPVCLKGKHTRTRLQVNRSHPFTRFDSEGLNSFFGIMKLVSGCRYTKFNLSSQYCSGFYVIDELKLGESATSAPSWSPKTQVK